MNEPQEGAATPPRPGATARRRRWALAVAGTALALTVGGVLVAGTVKSPAQAAADAGPPPADVLTAPVEHRVLVTSVITRGQVTAEQSLRIKPQVSPGEGATSPVVTRLPVRQGEAIRNGKVLVEVSGRPVIALRGSLPSYRDLRPGSSGDDVRQLQTALGLLGHPAGRDEKGVFGAGTQAALAALYRDTGYTPLPAQNDEGAALTAARAAVRQAERALEDARAAAADENAGEGVDKNRGEGTHTDGTRSARDDADRIVRRAVEDLAAAQEILAEAEAAAGPMLPAGEVVYLTSFPARLDAVQGKVGSEAAQAALTVSAGRLLVQAYVPTYQKELLRPQQKVEIHSELTGVTASARVASVADTPTEPPQGESDGQQTGPEASGYLVEVVPDRALDERLTGQDVRLTIEAGSTGTKALVVPITALSSEIDGRTVVTVVTASGDRRRVEVRPGATGDGYVAVTPLGGTPLRAGDEVVTGIARDAAPESTTGTVGGGP
ncbi:peptidoglycan-binding protein [Streptomyces sp. CC208A]|uniref:peptidoglycan-binding domain-containing protein n=1 Tax=Streptomyces sp. CC208A TaxID=3044573 RepID=UPI0024A81456|nr:peptidoglycan-binding protein [Streptomyces sp. CC208A]